MCKSLCPRRISARVNLGFSGTLESIIPEPGLYFFNYYHNFHGKTSHDESGDKVEDTDFNIGVWLHQLTYISKIKVLKGNLGASLVFPLVFTPDQVLLADSDKVAIEKANPSKRGDLTLGLALQWFEGKLFEMNYAHRFELNIAFPIGSFDDRYGINPGSGFLNLQPSYGFTLFFDDRFSVSQRHHITFNTSEPDSELKAGKLYHGIYSFEYQIIDDLWMALHSYYLHQISNDLHQSLDLGIGSREKLAALGPAVNWVVRPGLMLGAKYLREVHAVNRIKGSRINLKVIWLIM